ncbi:tetratricopeptide repeat protein [Aeoliella sp. ICT_H6.2]|uniref:Tetratricopeptide repeat protein n=1 Tax=Aeoliella straminimaris TaxID=2954799 RepID=A0A9X2FG96_9BACT|nr:tetratricopeptide repeat protein [Aeoliella straminimaris]MCO6047542.1 tetratricopeptide repeat protein [Aeoliella straminimaris]
MSSPPQARPVSAAVRQRLQQLFEHGKKSLDKGDFQYAHDMFAQCVSEDPANLVYLQHLRANLARKHPEAKKSSLFGGSRKLKTARSALSKAIDKGDWDAAFAAGCEALDHGPNDVTTLLDLARASAELGATECQLYYLKWALDAEPKHEQANRQAADALAAVGQFEQAIACLKRVQEIKPQDHMVAKTISRMSVEQTIQKGGYNQELLRKGSSESATPDADASSMLHQAHPAPEPEAAEEALAAEPAKSREKQLLEQIRLYPAELENYRELADEYTQDERYRDAERVLQKALTVSSGDLDLRERLEEAQIRRLRQQTEVADRRAESEGTDEARKLARKMHAQANQVELEVFAARAERNPGNLTFQYELGLRLKRAGKFREAIQALQAARADNRRLADTQLHLGECFQKIEQFRLAMSSYEAAVAAATDPSTDLHKLARYRAGVLAMGLGELDKAEKHLTELAAADFGYRDVADRLDKLGQMRNT